MQPNTACAGECVYQQFKLQYQVVQLEYVRGKCLSIVAICYNPYNSLDKESTLKYSTSNLNIPDKRLDIAMSMVDDVIKNLELDANKLYKLVIKDSQAFFVCAV
jgi:hypothetical protein